ncbi:hypothetical protein ACWGCI_39200 [Streptomyces sp. NPDC054949]
MGRNSQKRRAVKKKVPRSRDWRSDNRGPRFPLVLRHETEVIDGRMYPPTTRVTVEGEAMALDAIATLCGIAEGRITGEDARAAAALIRCYEEGLGMLDPSDDMDLDEYIASHTRLFEAGFLGYDRHGGYMSSNVAELVADLDNV